MKSNNSQDNKFSGETLYLIDEGVYVLTARETKNKSMYVPMPVPKSTKTRLLLCTSAYTDDPKNQSMGHS